MKKRVTLVKFSDLLRYAQSIGMGWNKAHDILVKDEVPPMYESNSRKIWVDEVKSGEYSWSEDSLRIVEGFMKSEDLEEMTLIND